MENKSTQNSSQLYHFTPNEQLKQESQSELPIDSNSDSNQLENIPENSQSQQTNTTSHVHPQLQLDYEYSTIDSLSNQYLLSQQQQQQRQPQTQSQLPPPTPLSLSVQSNTQTPATYPQQQQQQQVMGTPPQVVQALLNKPTSTPQLNSSSSVPPPTSIQQQQYQNYSTSTTNIHDEILSSSRNNPAYELRHSHSFPTTRSFYQTTMQPPPLPPPPLIQDLDIQGSSLSIFQSPQPSLQHGGGVGGIGITGGGFYATSTQPSVPSSLVSSANTSTLTIATTSNPSTTVGGSSSNSTGSSGGGATVPPISFPVPTHIDVNQYPDMTTFVNSNTNIVVPLVEHRFVDNKICVICGKKITRDMSRHMRTHQLELRFNCKFPRNQCHHKLGKFNRPYDFKKHLLNRHFKFDDPSIKRLHNLSDKLNHRGTCPCGLRFIGKDWLDDHILTDDLTKKCPFID